jgi:predicted RNA binding protein YcfA (HicA-like mRNA interferase family)
MGQGAKRLAQMRNNPSGDWQIADIEVVCREYGIFLERPKRGSHWSVFHPGAGIQIIPVHRSIKVRYIREFVRFVDMVTGDRNDD